MILTHAELDSLVGGRHATPHELLGMHPLGGAGGVVVRAFAPGAARVEVAPVHEAGMPSFALKQIHPDGLFEGSAPKASRVYAYDLIVTDAQGNRRQGRDPYSFLPTLGESDLFLFAQGNEHRIYDKLGSHLTTLDGVAGASFAVWAPLAQRGERDGRL